MASVHANCEPSLFPSEVVRPACMGSAVYPFSMFSSEVVTFHNTATAFGGCRDISEEHLQQIFDGFPGTESCSARIQISPY